MDDRERVTQKILDAFIETGQRLLLSKGWANLGEGFNLPDTVMLLVDTPHDWLLPKCSAVVHHGGAGTTAAGALPLLRRSICSFLWNLRSCCHNERLLCFSGIVPNMLSYSAKLEFSFLVNLESLYTESALHSLNVTWPAVKTCKGRRNVRKFYEGI